MTKEWIDVGSLHRAIIYSKHNVPLNHDPWSVLYTDSAVLMESNLI